MIAGLLERAIPARGVDADRPNLDAVLLRVAHDLGWSIEAHRLTVEQRGAEDIRVPAFEPGARIGDQREARGMGFREPIAAEPFCWPMIFSANSSV